MASASAVSGSWAIISPPSSLILAAPFVPSGLAPVRMMPTSPGTVLTGERPPFVDEQDAALALAMCKVIIDADLHDKQFVQEQTDLPLLVRRDNGRFLRGPDVKEGEREDQFYWWDMLTGTLTPAPRGTLATTGVDPAHVADSVLGLVEARAG